MAIKPTFTSADARFMAQALQLAQHGLNTTAPNPRVGCVLVKDQQVTGQGWHVQAGHAHAEINAIKDAGALAEGATAYVTLEPCAHQGRTGACAMALIAAKVSKVICAMVDPNPLVAGKGISLLEDAGISCQSGLMQAEAEVLNPGFIKRMRHGLPWVRIKLGMSLDGRTAMASGESQWITSPQARQDVQHWRARSSAIITGSGTVLADDPSMTVRLTDNPNQHQPLRVVLDSQLRTPATAKIIGDDQRCLIFSHLDQALNGATVIPQTGNGPLALRPIFKELAKRGCNEILVEAGPTLAGAVLAAGLADEVILYQAPTLLGSAARGAFALPKLQQLAQAPALNITDVRQIGPDLRIIARPEPSTEP